MKLSILEYSILSQYALTYLVTERQLRRCTRRGGVVAIAISANKQASNDDTQTSDNKTKNKQTL